jgi:hypothetical protein
LEKRRRFSTASTAIILLPFLLTESEGISSQSWAPSRSHVVISGWVISREQEWFFSAERRRTTDAGEQDPQEPIDGTEPGAVRRLAPEDGELVPEGQDLRLERETRGDGGPERGQHGHECGDHAGGEGYQR